MDIETIHLIGYFMMWIPIYITWIALFIVGLIALAIAIRETWKIEKALVIVPILIIFYLALAYYLSNY